MKHITSFITILLVTAPVLALLTHLFKVDDYQFTMLYWFIIGIAFTLLNAFLDWLRKLTTNDNDTTFI